MSGVATAVKEKLAGSFQPLALDIATVKKNYPVAVREPDNISPAQGELGERAKAQVAQMLAVRPEHFESVKNSIDSAGNSLVQKSSHQSKMLKNKMGTLLQRTEDGGPIATSLLNLRDQVSELDPSGIDFNLGWWGRLMGNIPFIGNRVKNYFNRYETGQSVINQIIQSLENGRKTLVNDNTILAEDQIVWRKATLELRDQIAYLKAVDAELDLKLPTVEDPDLKRFLGEEVMFPLRQKIMDLQQRLAVNQQGIIVAEILIRNNRELIRGVNRALGVTVDALSIAVTAALALANQKLVLRAIEALNKTTEDMIAGTAERIKTQGAAIHKQASSTMLASGKLKQAFADLNIALDDIGKYRRDALTKMGQDISELDLMTAEAEKSIGRMERGNKAVPSEFNLDLQIAA